LLIAEPYLQQITQINHTICTIKNFHLLFYAAFSNIRHHLSLNLSLLSLSALSELSSSFNSPLFDLNYKTNFFSHQIRYLKFKSKEIKRRQVSFIFIRVRINSIIFISLTTILCRFFQTTRILTSYLNLLYGSLNFLLETR
jgi:hypothetical protein